MQPRTFEPSLPDPEAREFLRAADPVLAMIIDARPDFRPRPWTQDLPALDAFSTLIFQVIGQQLSVRAIRHTTGCPGLSCSSFTGEPCADEIRSS